jgi:HSP20 family protein
MSITKWTPLTNLISLTDRLNRLFDEGFWGEMEGESMPLTRWQPATDIYETKDSYNFKIELPGFKKDDVNVEIKDNTLMIRGEKKMDNEVKKENYHRIERFYGSFQRTFQLPQNVEAGKVKAKMESGVLEIVVPKSEKAKAKSIPVEVK